MKFYAYRQSGDLTTFVKDVLLENSCYVSPFTLREELLDMSFSVEKDGASYILIAHFCEEEFLNFKSVISKYITINL